MNSNFDSQSQLPDFGAISSLKYSREEWSIQRLSAVYSRLLQPSYSRLSRYYTTTQKQTTRLACREKPHTRHTHRYTKYCRQDVSRYQLAALLSIDAIAWWWRVASVTENLQVSDKLVCLLYSTVACCTRSRRRHCCLMVTLTWSENNNRLITESLPIFSDNLYTTHINSAFFRVPAREARHSEILLYEFCPSVRLLVAGSSWWRFD